MIIDKATLGLICTVYRDNGPDCTANGVTSKADVVLLIGEGITGPMRVSEAEKQGMPVLVLRKKPGLYKNTNHLHAVPYPNDPEIWWMMGGNFIWSGDSRFRTVSEAPIPVHDRREW